MSAEHQTPNAGTPAPASQEPTAEPCDLRSLGASHGSAAYLCDDVTVGELMRWINAEAVKAGRANDRDYLNALCRVGERVESALSMYRLRHCDFMPNTQDVERRGQ